MPRQGRRRCHRLDRRAIAARTAGPDGAASPAGRRGLPLMYTLGINAAYHDSAACLVKDGVVIAAAEDERFTHVKHAKRPVPFSTWELPFHAIDYCLAEAGITLADVDHVAYSYDPYLLLGRHRGEATIALPMEPSAQPTPAEWESPWDPLFLSSIVNAP